MAQFWEELIQLNNENKLDKRFAGTILFTRLRPMFELFELEKDPGEFVNLSGKEDYREIEHRMKAALHRWMIIYRDVVPLPIPPPNWQHPEELYSLSHKNMMPEYFCLVAVIWRQARFFIRLPPDIPGLLSKHLSHCPSP